MKAFWSGVAAAILIAIVAGFVLDWMDWSSASVYQSPSNVRL